jgi:uncharacterized Zn finger protein (UPF0148 family)
MAYKCQKCDAPLLVLRLGYCSNCREPISSDILTESKKQELVESEREYERERELKLQQKDKKQQQGGGDFSSIDLNDFGS